MSEMGDELVARQLREAIGRFVRATRARADQLPDPHAQTLGLLHRDGPMSVAELAAGRGIRHQSVRVTVLELEQQGWVTRRDDLDDRRKVVIDISPAGRRVWSSELERRTSSIAEAMQQELSDDERKALGILPGLLDRLSRHLSGP